ncbi:MAG: hypothetical protein SFW08_03355 [Gemmatimonadaceae bacterium]|nr:hypothetical protein [Gemmatimonadaceae bacterium]
MPQSTPIDRAMPRSTRAVTAAQTLNNLLTIIECHAEFLSDELDPTSPLVEHCDAIRAAVARAAQATERLVS